MRSVSSDPSDPGTTGGDILRTSVAIVGAGPTGLAAGIHARRLGIDHLIIEKGSVVNSIIGFPTYMTFFSTAERLSLAGIPFTTPNFRPTRQEAIIYYQSLVRAEELNLLLGHEVTGVRREASGGFRLDCGVSVEADFLILATGYFDQTNRLEIPGEELPHVHHYYQEPFEWYRRRVLVIGGRNSAAEAALDLYRHGAEVTMIHRREDFGSGLKYWIRPDIENRIAEGSIKMHWNTEATEISSTAVRLHDNISGLRWSEPFDGVFPLIGYRPDQELLDECGVVYDRETLVPSYDPATFETNVPNLFLAGSIACGCKTWEIFIENGREHARQVISTIDSRLREVKGS